MGRVTVADPSYCMVFGQAFLSKDTPQLLSPELQVPPLLLQCPSEAPEAAPEHSRIALLEHSTLISMNHLTPSLKAALLSFQITLYKLKVNHHNNSKA